MEEQSLIAGCKRGESWAHRKLYELHSSAMMSVCMRYMNNKEMAKDVLQEGFIKIFTKMDSYSGTGSFAGWMRRIFVTTALEHLRNENIFKTTINIDEYDNLSENFDASVLDHLCADDLMNCIAQLPAGFRTVFNLFAIEGYSHSEIAKILDIKESTSRSQFVRAKKVLQKNVQSLMIYENEKQYK